MMMQQQQRMAFWRIGQFTFQPLKLKLAQLTVRHAKHLAIQQQDLPLLTNKHPLRRGDTRIL
ncbi:Uncharacterised protein [Shigella sonnei]|nr:Uncharacterised protein [Shigella sonnei]